MALEKDTDHELDKLREAAAKLVHDLRTPLLTIKNLSSLISEGKSQTSLINKQVDKINSRLDQFCEGLTPAFSDPPNKLKSASLNGSAVHHLASGQPKKVLVVDDDMLVRSIASRVLESMDCFVDCAESGEAALNHDSLAEFHVVFLDLNMPGLSGLECAMEIRKMLCSEQLPFLVGMSNDPREAEVRAYCKSVGMDAYIQKPLTAHKCREILQTG